MILKMTVAGQSNEDRTISGAIAGSGRLKLSSERMEKVNEMD